MDIKEPQRVYFSKNKIFWSVALCGYLIVVYMLTVFMRGVPNEIESVRLKLFWSYGWGMRTFGWQMVKQIVENVAMLFPVGYVARKLGLRKWYWIIIIGFLISLSIETLQLLVNRGLFESDDLFHNSVGCLLGYFVACFYEYSKKDIIMGSVIRRIKDNLKTSFFGVQIMRFRRNNRGRSKKNAYQYMERFGMGGLSTNEKKVLYNKMKWCSNRYHFNYQEFFLYKFYELEKEIIREFVSDSDHVQICESLNKPSNQYIFDDKSVTTKVFKKYYKRESLLFESENDFNTLKEFLVSKQRIIIKPLSSACGSGVKIVDVNESTIDNVDELVLSVIKTYCSGALGGGIAEEIINQDDRLKKLHPQSLNTLRIPTIRLDDRVELFYPFFRVGRGDSIVDNGGAGGIVCAVDSVTGTIVAAEDEAGVTYDKHPDTRELLVGYTIPRWNEAVQLANELANVIPSNRYTGWDLALTADGWVLVEANARGQWLAQIPLQKGFRKDIESLLKELK